MLLIFLVKMANWGLMVVAVFLPRDCEEHRSSLITLPGLFSGERKATMIVCIANATTNDS
jgi:hypothetical protein